MNQTFSLAFGYKVTVEQICKPFLVDVPFKNTFPVYSRYTGKITHQESFIDTTQVLMIGDQETDLHDIMEHFCVNCNAVYWESVNYDGDTEYFIVAPDKIVHNDCFQHYKDSGTSVTGQIAISTLVEHWADFATLADAMEGYGIGRPHLPAATWIVPAVVG